MTSTQQFHNKIETKYKSELELPYLEEVSGDLDGTATSTVALSMN